MNDDVPLTLTDTIARLPSPDTAPAAARDRLRRLRDSLAHHEIGGAVIFDSINLRYACDSRNMQINTSRNPGRYVFVPANGPVVLFEYAGCGHLAESLDTVDEIRPAHALHPLYTVSKFERHLERFVGDIGDLMRAHAAGNAASRSTGRPPPWCRCSNPPVSRSSTRTCPSIGPAASSPTTSSS